jgi:hypothetical protein
LIYFFEIPLTAREIRTYHMREFAALGYEILVVDMSVAMYGDKLKRALPPPPPEITVAKITDWPMLETYAETIAAADLVFLLAEGFGPWLGNLPALRLVSRVGVPYIIMSINSTFANYVPPNVSSRLRRVIARLRRMRPINSIIRRLPLCLLGCRPADFVVYDGEASVRSNTLVGPTTRTIWAHSSDYETWLKAADAAKEESDTAVFLDQYIPYHPEFSLLSVAAVDAKEYHAAMNRLFDQIEERFSLRVVIASHPQAKYDVNPFGGRTITYGRSVELVRSARLVIAHYSTAVSFAILSGKPLLLCATDPLYRCHYVCTGAIDGLAAAINRPVVFADKPISLVVDDVMTVDQAAYERFRRQKLKFKDDPEYRSFWPIIADAVNASGLARLAV